MIMYNEKELGDYQTPLYFTEIIYKYLKNELKIKPDIIIEPTCGIGNFLKTSNEYFPGKKIYGIEIDSNKLNSIKYITNLTLINEDIFKYDFNMINHKDSYLIIGNPPWVTNTELSKINSKNIPEKSNIKNKKGIDAITGNSNFDISESIILKIIDEFKDTSSTIAFLCKTSVVRNIFKELIRKNITYSYIHQFNFNGMEVFKADVDCCLFILQTSGKALKDKKCRVSNLNNPSQTLYEFGYVSDKFYSNIGNDIEIDGECQFEWRQGVKHDLSRIMELECVDNHLKNKNNEIVNIESTLTYPLLKSSSLKKAVICKTNKYVIITQKRVKEDTFYIKSKAPKTWTYLNENKDYFNKRKSSIYKNAPDFSIFGIGEYSFKRYKVAISGFYKNPVFSLVYSHKTMMLDDTCYFLSFDDYNEAYITMLILNSPLVKKFLKNIAFLDSKRPYTKKVLKRIDIKKCLKHLSFKDLSEIERELELESYITQDLLKKYTLRLC